MRGVVGSCLIWIWLSLGLVSLREVGECILSSIINKIRIIFVEIVLEIKYKFVELV